MTTPTPLTAVLDERAWVQEQIQRTTADLARLRAEWEALNREAARLIAAGRA